MSFVVGEVDSREQNPWAYDTTNDLLKTVDDLSLTRAGLVTVVAQSYTNIAAGGNTVAYITGITIPSGKVGYLLDFSGSVASAFTGAGTMIFEIYANSGGGNVGVYSVLPPLAGGMISMPNPRSMTFAPGTVGFAVSNTDAADHRMSCRLAVAIL